MKRKPKVQVVTSARRSASDDISARQRHYLYAMAVRTAALVLAIFVLHGPLRFVALVLGMVLPWVSVTSANVGPLPDDSAGPEPVPFEERRQLPPGGPTIDMDR